MDSQKSDTTILWMFLSQNKEKAILLEKNWSLYCVLPITLWTEQRILREDWISVFFFRIQIVLFQSLASGMDFGFGPQR